MPIHFSYLPMLVPGSGGGGGSPVVDGRCDATTQIGQLVYISGNNAAGERLFAPSSCVELHTVPSVGVIIAKPLPTYCQVATFGLVDLPGFLPNLDVGQNVYVGIDGYPSTSVLTDFPEDIYLQRVGTASKPHEVVLQIGEVLKL